MHLIYCIFLSTLEIIINNQKIMLKTQCKYCENNKDTPKFAKIIKYIYFASFIIIVLWSIIKLIVKSCHIDSLNRVIVLITDSLFFWTIGVILYFIIRSIIKKMFKWVNNNNSVLISLIITLAILFIFLCFFYIPHKEMLCWQVEYID